MNAAISYYAFNTGNDSIGLFVGAIGTFFYAGNILGGYMAAKRYNNVSLRNMHERAVDEMLFEDDRAELFQKYGIGKYGQKK